MCFTHEEEKSAQNPSKLRFPSDLFSMAAFSSCDCLVVQFMCVINFTLSIQGLCFCSCVILNTRKSYEIHLFYDRAKRLDKVQQQQ